VVYCVVANSNTPVHRILKMSRLPLSPAIFRSGTGPATEVPGE
jgi:hypothetical protein